MVWSLVLMLLLCSVSVKSLAVTWNGTTITGPVLIFQDELVRGDRTDVLATPRDGTMICRSENQAQVGWHYANGVGVQASTTHHFRHRRTSSSATPSVSRLTTNRPDEANTSAAANGLWTCRLNGGIGTAVPVGIYARGGGHGAITTNHVSPISSSFLTFTLLGATSGGPPTTYTWTRNSQVITNSASYSITIQVERSSAGFQNSCYRSTLTVTGRLPGVYQYSVTNRATSGMVTDTFTIESVAPPTDLTAEQTGVSTVLVMWTAPSSPPTDGYQVLIRRGSTTTTVNVTGTSYTKSSLQYGVYSFRVKSLTLHFPSEATEPVEITVRDHSPPVISTPSPTATTVIITWTQPEFSIPVFGYTVTVTRLNGLAAARCASNTESRLPVTTTSTVMSVQFSNLQEFSSYRATVTAMFSATFEVTPASSNLEFSTHSAAPTGVPRSLSYTMTSTTVNINWHLIDCIERNGVITDYTVVFQEQGGAVIPGEVNVMDRTFIASGLTPHTNYIFRVAGVNSNGTGPYSNGTTVLTDEHVPGVVSDLTGQPKFTSIVLTWSAPQEPNGVIISYEVTYRVSDGNHVTTNTTDLRFTIPSLTPGTNVTEISVSAYTSVGRGDPVHIPHLMTARIPPLVKILEIEVLSGTSIKVSWDRLETPEITRYVVYYRLTRNCISPSQNTTSSEDYLILNDLVEGAEYRFEVVAVAELHGEVVMGERSEEQVDYVTPTVPAKTTMALSITAVVTFILTLILYTLVLLLVVYCVYCCRGTNNTKSTVERVDPHNMQAVYEEVGGTRMTKAMEMKANEAYSPVSSSQPPPPPASEGAYDL